MFPAADLGRRLPADRWPPLPLLWLLTLVPLRLTAACMETAWSRGFMTPENATLLDTVFVSGSCSCCGVCHQRPGCASLAIHDTSGECRLYGGVAGYATLTPHVSWTYLVRPGRSQLQQFCRDDTDCADGAPCRGRVCTNRDFITCRDIRDRLGAGDRYGLLAPDTPMYGWMDGRPLALACLFSAERPGYTRLFQNVLQFRFSRETIQRYNTDLSDGLAKPHSILYLAEQLRGLRKRSFYRLLIESPGLVTIEFRVPRDEPVLATKPRNRDSFTIRKTGRSEDQLVSLPYLPTEIITLLSANGGDAQCYQMALARGDGSLNWEGELPFVSLYILE